MNTEPYALVIADTLEKEIHRMVKLELMYRHAVLALRQLHQENAALRAKLEGGT